MIRQFSIITPTYNRAKYLPRIYNCLCKHDSIDKEWIIIDDGSTDNTKDVVLSFKKTETFEIKYNYQKNAGKPTAMNAGIQMASGHITLVSLDSDDILCTNALDTAWNYFEQKTGSFENNCAGLSGLCQYENGDIIGKQFPHDYFISDYIRYIENEKIKGDKCDFFATSILKKYSYPIFENEKNIAPGILHIRIALTHQTLYVNKIFQEKQFLQGGLSTQNYWLMYPRGAELYCNETSAPPFSLMLQIKHSGEYIFYAKMNHKRGIFKEAKNKLIFPLGFISYCLLCFKHFLKKFRFLQNINDMLKNKNSHWKKFTNE